MKKATKDFIAGCCASGCLQPGHAAKEIKALSTLDRVRASDIFAMRDELEDLRESEAPEVAGRLEELDQKLGGYMREARKLQDQRKLVRGVRQEILEHVQQLQKEVAANGA